LGAGAGIVASGRVEKRLGWRSASEGGPYLEKLGSGAGQSGGAGGFEELGGIGSDVAVPEDGVASN